MGRDVHGGGERDLESGREQEGGVAQETLGPAPSSHPTPKLLAYCTHHCYKRTMALTQQPARLLGDGSVRSFIHSFTFLFFHSCNH